jgi:hypothetical protein
MGDGVASERGPAEAGHYDRGYEWVTGVASERGPAEARHYDRRYELGTGVASDRGPAVVSVKWWKSVGASSSGV